MSFLNMLLPLYCILSTMIFYMTFEIKNFWSAFRFVLLTFYTNIIFQTVVINQNYCLLFEVPVSVKVVRTKASTHTTIHTIAYFIILNDRC